jgi:hypothetical protein
MDGGGQGIGSLSHWVIGSLKTKTEISWRHGTVHVWNIDILVTRICLLFVICNLLFVIF